MPKQDLNALHASRREWMSGSRSGVEVRAIFGLLQELEMLYGEDLIIELAMNALDRLLKTAQGVKQDLQTRTSQ